MGVPYLGMDPGGRSWPEGTESLAGRIAPLWPLLAMLRIQNDFYKITYSKKTKKYFQYSSLEPLATAAIFPRKLHNFTCRHKTLTF
jgi:hypothetical protein